MKHSKLLPALLLLFIGNIQTATAQNSRNYIKQQIREWGECRNVAITKSNGDVALYGANGWAGSGLPSGLSKALREKHDDGEYITDVQLTESGNWLLVIGQNGFRWDGIPNSLEKKLYEYNENNYTVTSVTFNDAGDWIIISEEYYASSDTDIQQWLKEGSDKYGSLWAACISTDAIVACYAKGYRFYGNVPEDLKEALGKTTIDVSYIKIAGEAWFFADKNGSYQYKM